MEPCLADQSRGLCVEATLCRIWAWERIAVEQRIEEAKAWTVDGVFDQHLVTNLFEELRLHLSHSFCQETNDAAQVEDPIQSSTAVI
jgi:hypothetical protein